MRAWLVIAFLVAAHVAEARPGGGHSSSGGSRSSSSSRSSGGGYRSSGGGGGGGNISGGGAVAMLVLFGIVIVFALASQKNQTQDSWTSGEGSSAPPRRAPADLSFLLGRDPAFSRVVFEDFVFDLYSTAQRTRNDPAAPMTPYLSAEVARLLALRGLPPQQVVIGTLAIERHTVEGDRDRITVRIEATLFENVPVYVVEHWRLSRPSGVASKPPPARTRTFPCPNCGAPWTAGPARVCASCGADVDGGFDWQVDHAYTESSSVAHASLTGTVEEYGNELPTVVDANAAAALAAITADDPQVTWESLRPRIQLIYAQLNTAWNANDLTSVRGLVTASLRNYLDYWLKQYAADGLKNRLDHASIQNVELAKVLRDSYFDAITVRVFAVGSDYTLASNGNLVGGSPSDGRYYTEYWTFIRSSARRGPVTATPTCANCGAPLSISDAGECTHCNATLENGSFDWTLSKIEQDDYYAG